MFYELLEVGFVGIIEYMVFDLDSYFYNWNKIRVEFVWGFFFVVCFFNLFEFIDVELINWN